jgi:serine/threonine protein phosphatase PrpC
VAFATLSSMLGKIPKILAVTLLLSVSFAAFGASKKRQIPIPPGPTPITLGETAVPLAGPWKFSPADSPWDGGTPLWSQPNFDDSSWATIDLTPPAEPFDLALSSDNALPGWSAKGFPNLTGYAWYRLRIHVANTGQPVWLKMPADFEDAYQIYANGQFVGQFGDFDASPPVFFVARPLAFPLPLPPSNGEVELALRFYMSPVSAVGASSVGGMHEPPILGPPLVLRLIASAQYRQLAFSRFGQFLTTMLFLLIAPAVLLGWLQNRRELTFLWLFIELTTSIPFFVVGWLALATRLPADSTTFWLSGVLDSIWVPGWIMVWWYWFGIHEKRWIPWVTWLMAFGNLVVGGLALSPARDIGFLSLSARNSLNDASLLLVAATCGLLLIVLVEGYRRDRVEGILATTPIVLLEIAALFNFFSPLFHIPYPSLHVFGLSIDVGSISSILLALVVGALAMRRFLRTRLDQERARQAIEQDLVQARELQEYVLVPEEINSPDFTVETQYQPAQTVGGDFFQTIPGRDSSLLIVIGDVSGKGVSAAMLVSVLIGAARTRANDSFDPASMLAVLNQRLVGRSGGHFATCLVAQLHPDGRLRIANAGHIAPYLNGAEMALSGSLPLGLAGKLEPTIQAFQLRPGDQLTFITDGVVEARNSVGEIFGFDRFRIISNDPVERIVARAEQFGQNDDITVLRVVYTAGRREMYAQEKS